MGYVNNESQFDGALEIWPPGLEPGGQTPPENHTNPQNRTFPFDYGVGAFSHKGQKGPEVVPVAPPSQGPVVELNDLQKGPPRLLRYSSRRPLLGGERTHLRAMAKERNRTATKLHPRVSTSVLESSHAREMAENEHVQRGQANAIPGRHHPKVMGA